jgi:N-carbamoyl-L-amino-acid hydrolase
VAAPGENLRINPDRLWNSIHELAEIGPGIAGGNNRQTLTDDDKKGRELFKSWCEGAGLAMGVDQMGTMFARREGTDPSLDPVFVGSHLDTQPTGGRYDGVLGVLSGLEVIRTLDDLNIKTRRPIVVVNWTNEEGARFAPAMMASGVFAGQFSLDYAYGRQDMDGKSFGDELKRIGWVGDEPVGARKFHSYFEYHIEQGPILEAEDKQIGVVTHGQGLWWLEFTLSGKEAHTGSTPMSMRVNAGLAMARIFEMVQAVAMSEQPGAVGGVGQVKFSPNSRNVLPGTVVFTIDIRSPEQAKLDRMRARIEAEAAKICEPLKVKCAVEAVGHFDPVTFDPALVDRVRNAATKLGYSHMNIISGAGHDACWAARVAPATMVMCPCVDGLSHNEAEVIS